MLGLHDPRWAELTHAYGSAADIPDLLRQLETAPFQQNATSEAWNAIWSALCHQGDVYTATYAAIPHMLAIATKKTERERLDFLSFFGYAEACRNRKGAPPIPHDLKEEYSSTINVVSEMFLSSLKEEWDEGYTKMLLGGLAAVKGFPKLGEVILDLDSALVCRECEADLSIGNFVDSPDRNAHKSATTRF